MIRIVDSNRVIDPSTVALAEFLFDAPAVSGSVQNCISYSNKWTKNSSGILVKKQKSLPDSFRRDGRRGEVRFSIWRQKRLEKREMRRKLQYFT